MKNPVGLFTLQILLETQQQMQALEQQQQKMCFGESFGMISAQPRTLIMYTFCDSNCIHICRFWKRP